MIKTVDINALWQQAMNYLKQMWDYFVYLITGKEHNKSAVVVRKPEDIKARLDDLSITLKKENNASMPSTNLLVAYGLGLLCLFIYSNQQMLTSLGRQLLNLINTDLINAFDNKEENTHFLRN